MRLVGTGPYVAVAVMLLAAGCGPVATQSSSKRPAAGDTLSAYGMGVGLPSGWNGRIVLGAEGRPVLRAASFPLPSNDDDSGEIAKESLAGMYVNVHGLGRDGSAKPLPVSLSVADFTEPDPPQGWRQATRDVAASGELYRITAVSGDRSAPAAMLLAEANQLLRTLALEPYVPDVVPSLPADSKRIEGYGISMRLPAGWNGKITRGELRAASSDTLSANDIRLRLLENGTSPQVPDPPFITGLTPIRLTSAEFVAPNGEPDHNVRAITGRSFIDGGRTFVIWVDAGSFPPSAQTVDEANEALASLTVQAGDFYPGTVEPATFGSAEGWHTGTNGTVDVQPDGQSSFTWASTIPYRDEPFDFPPSKTLERLPGDGIVIHVQLSGPDPRLRNSSRPITLPIRIADANSGSFEGLGPENPVYNVIGRAPGQRYDVDISVLFGYPHPTLDQLAAADAELARLHLPDWTSSD
jgi:hypothetical protein